METYEALAELKKVVPQERRAKSPAKKAELRRIRTRLEKVLLSDPSGYGSYEEVIEYATKVIKGRFLAGERFILEMGETAGPEAACEYAIKVIKGRWKAAEHLIALDVDAWEEYLNFLRTKDKKTLVAACKSNAVFAMWYAENVAKGEWKPGEKAILKGEDWTAFYYARAMGRRWGPAEKKILAEKDVVTCFDYADQVIKGRWPEAEKFIIKNPDFALRYAIQVIKGRWPEAEKFIIKNPDFALLYANNFFGGKWEEYEKSIINDTERCYLYAKDAIKGRLPEHMHQAMVMHSFSQPDKWVKKYLGAKKYNKVV
jgi:hypothetical protein